MIPLLVAPTGGRNDLAVGELDILLEAGVASLMLGKSASAEFLEAIWALYSDAVEEIAVSCFLFTDNPGTV